MDEGALIGGFFAAVFVAVAVGGLVALRAGMVPAVAVGCLLIGLAGTVVAGLLGWERWRFVSESVRVDGTLVAHGEGPVVEYRGPDGVVREVVGLGGSQQDTAIGEAVAVRVRAGDPAGARVADGQNLWGGVFAFTAFGLLPLAFGVFFGAVALGERQVRRVRRVGAEAPAAALSPMRRRLAANCMLAGNLGLVAAVLSGAFSEGDTLSGVGRSFLGVAVACAVYAVGFKLRREGEWQAAAICVVLMLGFAVFGAGALLLGHG